MKKFYEEIALEVLKFSIDEIRTDVLSTSDNAKDNVGEDGFPEIGGFEF